MYKISRLPRWGPYSANKGIWVGFRWVGRENGFGAGMDWGLGREMN